MADEELATEGGEALELAPENDSGGEEAAPLSIEGLASELGWTPKEQWQGEPEKWKPADQFIRDGRDIQQTTARELRSLREQMDRFGNVTTTLIQDKAAERDAYWKSQFNQAVEDGDTERANKLLDQRPAPAQTAGGPVPEVQTWVQRNAWFNSDPLAAMRAREITDRLAQQGLSVPQQLEAAERQIRKEFPEHFPQPAKQPPATQTGQSRRAAPSNRAKGFADMPAESQQMARDMMRRNPSVTLEAIATSYWADVEKSRRVG